MSLRIEFYHIDAFEAAHYEPIWRALRQAGVDARLVAVPGRDNTASQGWFDFDRLKSHYDARSIAFTTQTDYQCAAITTQNESILSPYTFSHIRLMYGPVIYPQAWGFSQKATEPFDAVLVHGPFYKDFFRRWKSYEELPVVGYPYYDDFFAGRIDAASVRSKWAIDPSRPTIVYLPTWERNSSLDCFLETISALAAQYNVLIKPHHCTLRMEARRMDQIRQSGLKVVDDAFALPTLFCIADVTLADARSAAFSESIMTDRPTVGLYVDPREAAEWMESSGIQQLAPVCTSTEVLPSLVASVLDKDQHQSMRREWTERNVAFRDGTAAQHAAEAIIRFVESRQRCSMTSTKTLNRRSDGGCGKTPSSPSTPTVSVVLPTYNHLRFLPKAIDSILQQTCRDFELIVVNDGSTDGTREYLDGLKDPRIRVIHQENKRLPEALNAGFRAARGELLTWVSADNYCAPAFLETLSMALEAHPEAGFAYSAFASVDEQDRVVAIHRDQDLSRHKMLVGNSSVASFIYRRACQEKIGLYDPTLEGAEDWDYWLRILEHFETVYVPVVLYYYRRHADTMSQRIRPKVVQSGRQVFRNAMERRGNSVSLAELYPTIRLCRDPRLAEFQACLDFSAGLLRSPYADVSVATEVLRRAQQLAPDCIEAVCNLALVYARLGQWEAALPLLRRVMTHTQGRNVLAICQAIVKAQELNDPERLQDVQPFALDKTRAELLQIEARSQRVFVPAQGAPASETIAVQTGSGGSGRRLKIAILPHKNNLSFMGEILARMRASHDVQIVSYDDKEGIGRALMSSDVCWIEWATDFAACVTQWPRRCRTILRLHSFEAFVSSVQRIHWGNVDDVVFVSPYIREVLKDQVPDIETKVRTHVIPNCVDLEKFYFKDKPRGKKIAFVGALRPAKNIPFLLQCFREIHASDPEYTLHVAGEFLGEELYRNELKRYIDHMEGELGLRGCISYYGHVENISSWLDDKDLILSTSLREGHPVNIIEGMAKGLKPAIHNFPGARVLYPSEWLFNTAGECRDIVLSADFERVRYRAYAQEHWSAEQILPQIDALLEGGAVNRGASVSAPRMDSGTRSTAVSAAPAVSAILSCYNAERFLPECLDSILNQTMTDWELHVLDDGSRDGTRRIIEDYAGRDARIKVHCFDDNKGPYVRRNFAIARAAAPFIVIHDADDLMCPNKLERLHAAISADGRLGVVGSFYRMFLDEHKDIEHCEDVTLNTDHESIIKAYRTQRVGDFCPHGMAIIRKQLFDAIGPYDENPFGADSFWLVKAAEYACRTGEIRLKNIPEFLTLRRMHVDSQTGRLPAYDPRSRRVKFAAYRQNQLSQVFRRLDADPTLDVKTELRRSVCNDFIERHKHLFASWESEPLTKPIADSFIAIILSYFTGGQFVRCIHTCDVVERVAPSLRQTTRWYDLVRGLAYFAIKLYDPSRKCLVRQYETHGTLLAKSFRERCLDDPDPAWTRAERVTIVRKWMARGSAESEAIDGERRSNEEKLEPPETLRREAASRRRRVTPAGSKAADTGKALKPMVTVITACHNAEAFLPECLDSIQRQTLQEWELLLVDDGSQDGTRRIMEQYAAKDVRIRPYSFDDNQGPYVRRNFAIEQANSDFIVIQDADDIMVPTKLQVLHNEISKDSRLGIVGSRYRTFLEEFKGLQYTECQDLPLEHDEIIASLGSWLHATSHGSAIIRRSLFGEIGPYDENPFASDAFWLAKLATYVQAGAPVRTKNVAECLTLVRMHATNQTRLLYTLDPRNRRARYRHYCEVKLQDVRRKMEQAPGTDIGQELRNCKCSDFLTRFEAQITAWESQPSKPDVAQYLLRSAVSAFNSRCYVSCVNLLNGVEGMEPRIAERVTGFELLRGMALYALDMKEHSKTCLEREIQMHGNSAAQAFADEGFRQGSQADVVAWCAENAGRHNVNLTTARTAVRQRDASFVGAASM